MQEHEKEASECYLCKEVVSPLYNFTLDENNNNFLTVRNKKKSNICHQLCPECLIRHIFLNEMEIFEKVRSDNDFTCPCSKGKINLNYDQLMDIFQNKIYLSLHKKKKKCKIHNKEYTNYCKDCNVEICDECSNSLEDEHLEHNIISKSEYIVKLKKFLSNAPVKYKKFEDFMEKMKIIGEKYKELLEDNFNENLILMDKIINNLIDFRTKYSVYYKKKVINGVHYLKILKMFYSNYFFDKSRAEKSDDINLYKYLNMISYELDDVQLIKNEESIQKLNEIMNNITFLSGKIDNLLEINYKFSHVSKNFKIFQQIRDFHKITSLVKINDSTILTGGEGRELNYWEEKNSEFVKVASISTDKISYILLLRNENILTSYGKNTHYTIQLWQHKKNNTPNNNADLAPDINNNQNLPEKLSLRHSVTVLNNYSSRETIAGISRDSNFSLNNPQNTNFPYEKTFSFLSNHKGDITTMIEINDKMFATGAMDNKIFIWKEDDLGKYKIFQELKNINDSISCMLLLFDCRIVSGTSNNIYIWHNPADSISNPSGKYSMQSKLNLPGEKVLSLYQIREGTLISGSSKSILTIWDEIDSVHKKMLKIDLKMQDIIAINQLSDKKIIAGAISGIIKILKKEGDQVTCVESIQKKINLEIKCIECFESGGFISAQNNSIIIWKNRENF